MVCRLPSLAGTSLENLVSIGLGITELLANAKVLAGLFPSSNSGSKRKRFDPEDDCIVAEQHRKKKSTTKGRLKLVNAVAMKEIPNSIPKGAFREHLKKIGQVQEISFDRHLSIVEVD